MKKRNRGKWTGCCICFFLLALTSCQTPPPAREAGAEAGLDPAVKAGGETEDGEEIFDDFEEAEEAVMPDPLEKINRAMFGFNDRVYFFVLKPLTKGYRKIIPERARRGIHNFFRNLKYPVRLANNLLQAKWKEAGKETGRFVINTLAGGLGFVDHAKYHPEWQSPEEDLGQTLGRWGLPSGFYIVWPFFGPSSLRDTAGFAGDAFLSPLQHLDPEAVRYGLHAGNMVNEASLQVGTYEAIKQAALDPYLSVKHGYQTIRENKVKE